MGNFMAKMGQNAANEGQGGMDPEGSGTAQGDETGGGDDPGGGPTMNQMRKMNQPPAPAPPQAPYIQPALQFSAAPQQTDIQNNFATSQQYAQRYGLGGRTHF